MSVKHLKCVQVMIRVSAMSADATYIENGHKIEKTEDRAPRIITWMHFKIQSLISFLFNEKRGGHRLTLELFNRQFSVFILSIQ